MTLVVKSKSGVADSTSKWQKCIPYEARSDTQLNGSVYFGNVTATFVQWLWLATSLGEYFVRYLAGSNGREVIVYK